MIKLHRLGPGHYVARNVRFSGTDDEPYDIDIYGPGSKYVDPTDRTWIVGYAESFNRFHKARAYLNTFFEEVYDVPTD